MGWSGILNWNDLYLQQHLACRPNRIPFGSISMRNDRLLRCEAPLGAPSFNDALPASCATGEGLPAGASVEGAEHREEVRELRPCRGVAPHSIRDPDRGSGKAHDASGPCLGQHETEGDHPALFGKAEIVRPRLHSRGPVAGESAATLPVVPLHVVEPVERPRLVAPERTPPSLPPGGVADVVRVRGADVAEGLGTGLQANRPARPRSLAPGFNSHRDESESDEDLARMHRISPRIDEHEGLAPAFLRTNFGVGLHLEGLRVRAPVVEPLDPRRAPGGPCRLRWPLPRG